MPNTITDTITELADNKSDIQDALVAKGVTSAGKHGFGKFAEDITNITNQYTSSDEGKVVNSGALVAQTDYGTVTENGTYDTTTNNSVTVNVAGEEIDGTFTRDSDLPSGWGLTVSTVQQQGKYVKVVGTITNNSSNSRTLNASTVIGQVSNLEIQGFSQSNITKWFNSGYTGIAIDCSNITSAGFTITSGVNSVTFAAKTPKDICVLLEFENS